MDVYVLLDVLLVILIALFVPIGFWRGAYREAFVTLGILFGAALGRFWGEPWGVELAAVTRLHESGGAFMIAMLSLISATFLLGYSSGAAIPVPSPGWVARILGALIAAANGALLLSFALRDIRVYLLTSEESGFLDNAVIAPFLSDGTGWILLVAAAIFVPISLVLALFGPDVEEEEYFEDEEEDYELYEADEYPEPHAQRTMQIDQRRPAFAKQQASAPTRQAPRPAPAEETRPIQSVPRPEPDPASSSGAETQPAPPQRVRYPQREQGRTRQQTPAPTPQPAPEDHAESTGAETHRPAAPSQPAAPIKPAAPIQETQPHRPQLGPQPPAEPKPAPREQAPRERASQEPAAQKPAPQESPAEKPVPEGPVFGTQSVQPPADSGRTSEPPGVFGYRPEIQQQSGGTDELPAIPTCPHCGADTVGADGYCPKCRGRI